MKKEFHDWSGTEGFCKKSKMWLSTIMRANRLDSCSQLGPSLLRCDGCPYYEEKPWTAYRKGIEKILVELGQ